MKNVALAIQMYLTDYDRLMPNETNAAALNFFAGDGSTGPGGDNDGMNDGQCVERAYDANPFLRPIVILDEYVKNRDVYRCASAKNPSTGGWIIPDFHRGGYLGYEMDTQGSWGRTAGTSGPCNIAWPTGWGGTVTDSILQDGDTGSSGSGAFEMGVNVNVNQWNAGASTSQMGDPSWYVACGDSGGRTDRMDPALLAYPDICILACASPNCWQADWDNCSWTRDCGARLETKQDKEGLKRYARHMGGSNVGFMDGHAKWFTAQGILAASPRFACGCWGGGLVEGQLKGFSDLGFPTTAAGKPEWGVAEGTWPGCAEQIPLY